jgi:ribosome-binding protein aMBF1 (putative translation factor)
MAYRERSLESHVLPGERGVRAQEVTEAKAPLKLPRLINEMQMIGPHRRTRIAEEASVGKRRVERPRELVAATCGQRRDVRVEVIHEGDHVDHRLCVKSRHSGRAEVVYLDASEQRPDSLKLSRKASRPRRVVLHDLDLGVAATGARQVFRCGASAIDSVHPVESRTRRVIVLSEEDRKLLLALGRAIRQLREERGMTPAELASAAEIEQKQLEALEAGRLALADDLLLALTRALDIDADVLGGGFMETPTVRETFGRRLRKLCEKRGLSQ